MRSRLILFCFLAVLLILGGAFVAGFFMPRQWSVRTQTVVQNSPAAVHPLVATPRRWPEWFAWNKVKDPSIVYTFSGPESGVGASLTWTSERLGTGTVTLTKSDPSTGVAYDLVISGFGEFPIRGEIDFKAADGTTTVTVSEGGELGSSPIPRLFRGVMEGKLAHDLQNALERLKALSEGRTPPPEPPPL
ncbi:MAG: SRPBCC family protein [Planctomycetota bacterium]|nr:SRPBCC family protein [Planctomycetota bacterium]